MAVYLSTPMHPLVTSSHLLLADGPDGKTHTCGRTTRGRQAQAAPACTHPAKHARGAGCVPLGQWLPTCVAYSSHPPTSYTAPHHNQLASMGGREERRQQALALAAAAVTGAAVLPLCRTVRLYGCAAVCGWSQADGRTVGSCMSRISLHSNGPTGQIHTNTHKRTQQLAAAYQRHRDRRHRRFVLGSWRAREGGQAVRCVNERSVAVVVDGRSRAA